MKMVNEKIITKVKKHKGLCATVVFAVVFGLVLIILGCKSPIEKVEPTRSDSLNDLDSLIADIKKNNGIINMQTEDIKYTMWYNSKGEVFVTDTDTYYIFLNNNKLIAFGLNEDMQTGYETTEQVDYLQQVRQEIANAKKVDKSSIDLGNGDIKTKINYSTDKEQRKLEIVKTLSGNYMVSLYTIVDEEEYLIWYFNGYIVGVYWELPDTWYSDTSDKEALLKDLVVSMEEKSREIISKVCATASISVSEYKNSGFSDDLFNQAIKEIEMMGYTVNTNFKVTMDSSIKDSTQNSLFEYVLGYGLKTGYITE